MELSLEAYRLIVNFVGNRTDICTLCRVSKGFRFAAERALYNTLHLRKTADTISLCGLLILKPQLAIIVQALTIFASDEESPEVEGSSVSLQGFWHVIASTLQRTSRLQYLNIHIDNTSASPAAWILENCNFRLRTFHCDLPWDLHLVNFLSSQSDLVDLYIMDYNDFNGNILAIHVPNPSSLHHNSLPNLAKLECTFTEAACALVPSRPITHLKTCFSRSRLQEKREELSTLLNKLALSQRSLRSLDLADSSYSETFSMEILHALVQKSHIIQELCHLGTVVLPINGRERLQFYGLLRCMPNLQCVEIDISEWDPSPPVPAGLRAIAGELRLYCSSLVRVIFVNDFERTVVTVVRGICVLDNDINPECLWRDI